MSDKKLQNNACSGESRLFWIPGGEDFFFESSNLTGRRINQDDGKLKDALVVALECRSFQGTRKQMYGHTAMIYNNFRWHMIFIVQQKENVIFAYTFDRNKFYDNSELKRYDMSNGNFFIVYVNIFIKNSEWFQETDYKTVVKNPITFDKFNTED